MHETLRMYLGFRLANLFWDDTRNKTGSKKGVFQDTR